MRAAVTAQEPNWRCAEGQGDLEERIGGLTVRVESVSLPDDPPDVLWCRAQVLDAGGEVVFEATDYALKLLERDQDVNGDGAPDLVFEGYSGGAHCCWSYWIVSLQERPALLAAFGNQRPATFSSEGSVQGRIRIAAADGAFAYFDGLSYVDSIFPTVFLELQGRRLRDVSHRFVPSYDREIEHARARLSPALLQEFLRSDPSREEKHEAFPVVLEIVLAYLYSGREAQAWHVLDSLWPGSDRARIRAEILKARQQGVLRWTAHDAQSKLKGRWTLALEDFLLLAPDNHPAPSPHRRMERP
jgi:hypothetical protein